MPKIVRRCCCIFYNLIIYVSIIYADYVVIRWIISLTMPKRWFNVVTAFFITYICNNLLTLAKLNFWGPLNVIIFNAVILFLMCAHYKAAFTDPGFVPLPQNKVDFSDMHSGLKDHDNGDWPVCDKCETYTPPRAHHCKICNRCIRKMDHHSFGINNCVGEENQKYFVQFLFYAAVLSLYSFILGTVSMSLDCPDCITHEIQQMKVWNSFFLCFLSAIFVIAALVSLTEQVQCITMDITAVEQVHKRSSFRPHRSKYLLASEVFGSFHIGLWLLPCYKGKIKRYNGSLFSHEV